MNRLRQKKKQQPSINCLNIHSKQQVGSLFRTNNYKLRKLPAFRSEPIKLVFIFPSCSVSFSLSLFNSKMRILYRFFVIVFVVAYCTCRTIYALIVLDKTKCIAWEWLPFDRMNILC